MRPSTRALVTAYAVSQTEILRRLYPVRAGALPLQWTTDETVVRGVVEGWTAAERERYRSHLAPDTVHPFVYVSMLVALERDLRGPGGAGAGTTFALAAATVGVCDLVENHHHAEYLRGRIDAPSVRRSGLASRVKWVVFVGAVTRLAQLGCRRSQGS